jgi:hypothetical protein
MTETESASVEKSQNRGCLWVLGAIAVFAIGATILSSSSDNDKPAASGPAALSEVTYDVAGTAASVDVTIETPTGTSQATVDTPMMNKAGTRGLTFQFRPGSFVYVSAQNNGASGTVTCKIKVDGIVIAENQSQGAYSIATCDGSA